MRFKRHLPKVAGTLFVLGVSVVLINFVRDFVNTPATTPQRAPQQVTLLTPPPPPPPPEIEEQRQEPEVEEEVELEEPEPVEDLPEQASDDPPAGSDLGIDADGGAGGDGFGLVGRRGGRGLLDGAGDPFKYYASDLSRRIEDALIEQDRVRGISYSVEANIWVNSDGSVSRVELNGTTGDQREDSILIETITGMRNSSKVPPSDMPQPIRMMISAEL
jgi:periplasmic protein TonB